MMSSKPKENTPPNQGISITISRRPRSKHQDEACDDANQPELGRAKLRVCQPEFAFQMRVHRHVEGQHKIDHQKHTRDVEPHERRHARAQEHERLVDGINRVVDIEAIDGPLLLPDPS